MPRLNEDCTPDEVQRFNETIKALHNFAQNPDTNRRWIIITGRQVGKTALREAAMPRPWGREDGPERFYPTDFLPMNDPSKETADSVARQINHELDALRYKLGTAAKKKQPEKPETDLKPRREVDRLRTADILKAMSVRNAADEAIPEEWMDELDDLVWRERDRLAADAGN